MQLQRLLEQYTLKRKKKKISPEKIHQQSITECHRYYVRLLLVDGGNSAVTTIKSDTNTTLRGCRPKRKENTQVRTEKGTEGQKDVIDTVSDISLDSSS